MHFYKTQLSARLLVHFHHGNEFHDNVRCICHMMNTCPYSLVSGHGIYNSEVLAVTNKIYYCETWLLYTVDYATTNM